MQKEQAENYFIEATLPAEAPRHEQMLRAANFSIALKNWITQEAGVEPSIEVVDGMLPKAVVSLRCTKSFVEKIRQRFASDIASINKAPTRDDSISDYFNKPKSPGFF